MLCKVSEFWSAPDNRQVYSFLFKVVSIIMYKLFNFFFYSLGKSDQVYKFLTVEIKPYYTAECNSVDKHTCSLARLKFLQQCLIENLALREIQYRPRLPQGLEANLDQILAWSNY